LIRFQNEEIVGLQKMDRESNRRFAEEKAALQAKVVELEEALAKSGKQERERVQELEANLEKKDQLVQQLTTSEQVSIL
jgi:3-methyladenine DNA glycosylase AlkD